MLLATIRTAAEPCAAIVDPAAGRAWPLGLDMMAVIAGERLPVAEGDGLPLADVALLAPLPRPRRNIFCVGKNYRDHAAEMGGAGALDAAPILFSKVPETVIAPDAPIILPRGLSEQIDYEAELAVVIGREGRGIAPEKALDHVFGYTIVNDVTARDLQRRHQQWLLGKSIDGFCPMGPWIATRDRLDLADTRLRLWVNEELRQDGRTADMIFDVPTLIATISAGTTLYPGDVIATGTPAGVGAGFSPPRFLQAGDRVAIEIEGIGRLENPVR